MTENLRKEQVSAAYVRLICSLAGVSCSRPELDIDSIDMWIHASGAFDRRSPTIEVQLISTTDQTVRRTDHLAFRLSRKNYDDLRRPTQNPRFLFVLILPVDSSEWFRQSEQDLALSGCAYWVSLRGAPVSSSQTITVKLPRANVLSPSVLRELLRA